MVGSASCWTHKTFVSVCYHLFGTVVLVLVVGEFLSLNPETIINVQPFVPTVAVTGREGLW